jgi:glycyl-tRNA synthetase beta chain
VGFFGVGIKPTGSKDPFALRRAALGVIRLILENRLRLPLCAGFAAAREGYGERLAGTDGAALGRELLAFLADRLKVHLREQGVRHDLIAAVFAAGEDDDLVRLLARVEALRSFLDTEYGRNLLVAYRRASGILAVEEKKDGRRYHGHPVPGAFAEPAEEALHAALVAAQERIGQALAAEDFAGAMQALAALRPPLDRFFETVMVNAAEPDLRVNRLLLLSQIRAGLERVADFSLIEEGGGARS